MTANRISEEEAMRIIEEKRQEAIREGIEPFAVVLNDEMYSAVFERRHELNADTVFHDAYLQPEYGGVLWWSQRDYEKAEEAWQDAHSY